MNKEEDRIVTEEVESLLKKGAIELTSLCPGQVISTLFTVKEKGQRLQASHQSKICKFTYPLSTLQDGGFASNKRSLKQQYGTFPRSGDYNPIW